MNDTHTLPDGTQLRLVNAESKGSYPAYPPLMAWEVKEPRKPWRRLATQASIKYWMNRLHAEG